MMSMTPLMRSAGKICSVQVHYRVSVGFATSALGRREKEVSIVRISPGKLQRSKPNFLVLVVVAKIHFTRSRNRQCETSFKGKVFDSELILCVGFSGILTAKSSPCQVISAFVG